MEKQQFWQALVQTAKLADYHCGSVMYPRRHGHSEWSALRIQVIEGAIKAGFFKSYPSKRGRSPHMSRLTVMRELSKHFDSDPHDFDSTTSPVVVLRDRETNENLPFDHKDLTPRCYRERLELINRLNSQFRITCRVTDPWGEIVTRQLRPVHYAVFTDDWNHHGRIYTGRYGHQGLKGIERSTIEFDGEKSVELDYSGYHCRMLYHQEGIEYPHDPYGLWGPGTTPEQRLMAKVMINAAINAKSRTAAISACNLATYTKTESGESKQGKAMEDAIKLNDAKRRCNTKFADVYDLAFDRHSRIAHRFGCDAGMLLMNLDGRIALSVLYHFARRSIPCLGVHDSFIVPRHAESELRETMLRCYEKRLNYLPVLKVVR